MNFASDIIKSDKVTVKTSWHGNILNKVERELTFQDLSSQALKLTPYFNQRRRFTLSILARFDIGFLESAFKNLIVQSLREMK